MKLELLRFFMYLMEPFFEQSRHVAKTRDVPGNK